MPATGTDGTGTASRAFIDTAYFSLQIERLKAEVDERIWGEFWEQWEDDPAAEAVQDRVIEHVRQAIDLAAALGKATA